MKIVREYFFVVLTALVVPLGSIDALGEAVPFELLRQLLPSNSIVLEAGAQFGEDTAWMSEMWPDGLIHSFEPSPTSFIELQRVAESHSNIHAYQLALSNKKGELPFYLAGGASSLLKPTEGFNRDYFHSDLDHPIYVQVDTLDDWAAENQVDRIDFMWLDMEGNELNALKGGINTLQNVKVIYTEVNLQRFWNGCVMYHEIKEWLEEQGFIEIWSDITPHWHGNVLFLNTNL